MYYIELTFDLTDYYNNGEMIASASDMDVDVEIAKAEVKFVGAMYDVYKFAKTYDLDTTTIKNYETNYQITEDELCECSRDFEENQ